MSPMLLPMVLASLWDPFQIVTQLEGADARPGAELRYVMLIEWAGEPRDARIVELPPPDLQNLRMVAVTRASRRRLVQGSPVTIMEIGYRLQPLRPGPARIAPSRLVCALGGTSHVLEAEGRDLRVPEPPASGSGLVPMGALGLGAAAAAASVLLVRSRRRAVSPGTASLEHGMAPEDPGQLDQEPVDALVRRARALGIDVDPRVVHACELYKFAGEEPDRALLEALREKIRARLASGGSLPV